MDKNALPYRVVTDNAFSRDQEGGTARQHPKLRAETAYKMRLRGIPEAICRAFFATGLMVTKENWDALPQCQKNEWTKAFEKAETEIESEKIKL